MNRHKLNSKGVTLVELLATLVIVGIVAALAFSIFFQGLSSYERIKMEAEMRDEADLIMTSFIKNLFVLKESEISSLKLVCTGGSPDSYLNVNKEGNSYFSGFKNREIIIKNIPIELQHENVSLVSNKCDGVPTNIHNYITEYETPFGKEYTIHFSLTTKIRGTERQMKFVNTIQVIND